ncbi:S-adenosyl-L-methionine-dependent methyltransferase [Pseudoneurospora amorphoporcata]|uniref:S-adenosyl-L-methionine-dependent methyltransferase n=1 Tax=Pseudoneurospora amorphoporcata TaxID=241081 RepID=A0AAN6SEB3_9PEZI|nr:S-adenosyl-L-methionine-dependent methyltransferase [Pseudoneurospora amorphoporcata]
MPDFDKQSYWHTRFESETAFEWLIPSSTFMPLLEAFLQKLPGSDANILHLGFGTSDLQVQLRTRGFTNITNVDYEPLATERGRHLEKAAFGHVRMRYITADATRLDSVPDISFQKYHLVIDKSTADAISCAGDDAVLAMAQGIHRSLADGGVWISVSYSAFRYDIPQLPFDVEVITKLPIAKARATDPDIYHYCYLLRPKPKKA